MSLQVVVPSMVMIDAISRLVPGVLNNEVSAEEFESFNDNLLEYPQYTQYTELWARKYHQFFYREII